MSLTQAQVPELADVTLDCSQKGWGVTPVVGLDWKASEYLNLGVKFEAPTKMVYKNTSTLSPAAQAASVIYNPTKMASSKCRVKA